MTITTMDQVYAQSAIEGHRLMPTVIAVEKGDPITAKMAGPGALYLIEGGHLFLGIFVMLTMLIF